MAQARAAAPIDVFDMAATLCPPNETETQSQHEDFSFSLWREIFKVVVQSERRALEIGETVALEVEVALRGTHIAENEQLIKIELTCEPGKPARLSCL